jgi:hypothetical protein
LEWSYNTRGRDGIPIENLGGKTWGGALGRLKYAWEDDIKMDHTEVNSQGVDRILLAQAASCEYSSKKGGDYQLLKKSSASLNSLFTTFSVSQGPKNRIHTTPPQFSLTVLSFDKMALVFTRLAPFFERISRYT